MRRRRARRQCGLSPSALEDCLVAPNAIDISNWSGEITPQEVASWKADGVSLVIIGAQVQSIAVQQAQTVIAGGLDWHIYQYLTYSGDVTSQVAQALALGAQFPANIPPIVWLDSEDETGNLTVEQRIAQHARARAMVAGAHYQPGTYTGKYYWQDYMGNTTQFAGDPLWFASYWDDGHTQQAVDFGGWTKAMIHQFKGTTNLGGVSVDFDYDFIMAKPPEQVTPTPEDTMTLDEFRAMLDQALTAGAPSAFRHYVDVAFNGTPDGTGEFGGPDGKALPLLTDNKLAGRVAAVEAEQAAVSKAAAQALSDIAIILRGMQPASS